VKKNELSWTIGGAQGSGVDSSANTFGRACAFGGLSVYGKREYYSNIKGEHSYFQVRVGERPVRSHVDPVNLLATFDEETAFRHFQAVTDDGAILFDPSQGRTRLADIPTVERRLQGDLGAFLQERASGDTLADALRTAEERGVRLCPVPYQDFLNEVAREHQVDQLSKIARMVNLMAVGASFGLLDYDFATLERAIRSVFRAKVAVAAMNVAGARKAYDHARGRFGEGFAYRLEPMAGIPPRLLLTGAHAVALGKIFGGCRFQTYYPITPASDESEYLEAHQDLDGGAPEGEDARFLREHAQSVLVVQTEDEIAAVTMATGAALAGARAATCTSGPGFCLMMEGLGWAGINEVPLVITLYQRAGPSTGIPTRHEQGDLRFALGAGHGDTPRLVLASGDLVESFYDAVTAFNWAERYQLPVIHLVDKALANSNMTIPVFDTRGIPIDRGLTIGNGGALDVGEEYRRFRFTADGISPRALVGTPGAVFWNTGDEHDEVGHITEDPVLRNRMMDKRMGKLAVAEREIDEADKVLYHGARDAETVIVSWGSTKGAILDALDRLDAVGARVGFLQVRLLQPFPTPEVTRFLGKAKRILALEMNYTGQLAALIREKTGIAADDLVVKFNGRPISVDEVEASVRAILKGQARGRVVLTHGA
jgi:2-oxoglutarate ferredoxin oxidoreductase subunit alpha